MSDKKTMIRALLVEDDDDDALTFQRHAMHMVEHEMKLTRAATIAEAEEEVRNVDFDLIFCDLSLETPLSGIEFMRQLQNMGKAIPVVVVTGTGDEVKAVQAMKTGAYDYVVKDVLSPEIIESSIFAVKERRAAELARDRTMELLETLSVTDALTQLPNRRRLMERMELEIMRAKRSGRPLSLLMLDLDHFKKINDTFGHQVGDEVLCTFADAVGEMVREVDLVARYGGEEFSVVLCDTPLAGARVVAERIRKTVEALSGNVPTVSIGLVVWASDSTAEQLIARADKALYRAKKSGRNRVSEYDPDTDESAPTHEANQSVA